MNLYEYICQEIKYQRKARDISQERLADLAGVTHGYISRLESMSYGIRLETLEKIFDVLDMTWEDFFKVDANLTSEDKQLILLIKSLQKTEKQELLQQTKKLLKSKKGKNL